MKSIAISALLAGTGAVFAHENHGLPGSHWHATDVWGFVALGAAFAIALWWSRGGK
jgi:hypothetical protein